MFCFVKVVALLVQDVCCLFTEGGDPCPHLTLWANDDLFNIVSAIIVYTMLLEGVES